MSDRPPFRGVGDALRFLFDPERVVCDRSATSRMADKRRGEPGPLAGLDGAATAGLAEDMLKGRLSQLHLAVLACRYAPALVRCECARECCSGQRPNPQWQNAAAYVTADAMFHALAGCNAHLRFVQAVLVREYGGSPRRINLTDVGEGLGMSLGACTGHRKRVMNWLLLDTRGVKYHGKNGEEVPPPPSGQELQAQRHAEEILRGGGFIP